MIGALPSSHSVMIHPVRPDACSEAWTRSSGRERSRFDGVFRGFLDLVVGDEFLAHPLAVSRAS